MVVKSLDRLTKQASIAVCTLWSHNGYFRIFQSCMATHKRNRWIKELKHRWLSVGRRSNRRGQLSPELKLTSFLDQEIEKFSRTTYQCGAGEAGRYLVYQSVLCVVLKSAFSLPHHVQWVYRFQDANDIGILGRPLSLVLQGEYCDHSPRRGALIYDTHMGKAKLSKELGERQLPHGGRQQYRETEDIGGHTQILSTRSPTAYNHSSTCGACTTGGT